MTRLKNRYPIFEITKLVTEISFLIKPGDKKITTQRSSWLCYHCHIIYWMINKQEGSADA
jgi:hypothetical protein